MVFGSPPYPIYNLSCLEIIPQIVYVFRLCRFRFQNPFSWFNRVFVNPSFLMMLSVAFVCTILVSHETFYHKPSVTDVNRYWIVFILVYISTVVGQQYISLSTVLFHVKLAVFHIARCFSCIYFSVSLFYIVFCSLRLAIWQKGRFFRHSVVGVAFFVLFHMKHYVFCYLDYLISYLFSFCPLFLSFLTDGVVFQHSVVVTACLRCFTWNTSVFSISDFLFSFLCSFYLLMFSCSVICHESWLLLSLFLVVFPFLCSILFVFPLSFCRSGE